MLTLAEEALLACIEKKKQFPNLTFYEIAEEDRDRFRKSVQQNPKPRHVPSTMEIFKSW